MTSEEEKVKKQPLKVSSPSVNSNSLTVPGYNMMQFSILEASTRTWRSS